MGDLLTFAIRASTRGLDQRRSPGLSGPGQRFGLRRGTSAIAWYETGCQVEGHDPERAIAAYQRAVAGCPGLADAHNNLGRLVHDAGAPARAEGSYRLAICADPGVALYWFNLGVAVEDQGRYAEAIAAYERAIELGGLADAHYNLARLLEQSGRKAGDAVLMRRAVRHLLSYRELTRRQALK